LPADGADAQAIAGRRSSPRCSNVSHKGSMSSSRVAFWDAHLFVRKTRIFVLRRIRLGSWVIQTGNSEGSRQYRVIV
jgi:hypothetical protein